MKLLYVLLFSLVGCGRLEFSPWQTNVTTNNLNEVNLELIRHLDQTRPFTIGLLSDPQGAPAQLATVIQQLNTKDIRFVMVTGDLTDYGLKNEYEWAYDGLKQSTTPFLVVPGNHDGLSKGKAIYEKMFGPDNYVFTFGGYKFVMWNNNKWEFKNTPNWSWLNEVVDSNTIMISHIPPIEDVFVTNEIDQWIKFNQTKGIKASIHGHRHSFAYWHEGETPYLIVPRVINGYALMTITENGSVDFELCKGHQCEPLQ